MFLEYVPKPTNPGIIGFSRIQETNPVTFGKSLLNKIVSVCRPGCSISNILKAFLNPAHTFLAESTN